MTFSELFTGIVHFIFHDDFTERENEELSEYINSNFIVMQLLDVSQKDGGANTLNYLIDHDVKSASYVDFVEEIEDRLFSGKNVMIEVQLSDDVDLHSLRHSWMIIDVAQRINSILSKNHGDIKVLFMVNLGLGAPD